jgi:hypothetical protein
MGSSSHWSTNSIGTVIRVAASARDYGQNWPKTAAVIVGSTAVNGHSDRPRTAHDEQEIAALQQAMAAGEPVGPIVVRYNLARVGRHRDPSEPGARDRNRMRATRARRPPHPQ